jgi:hypothetical protein
MTKSVEFEFDIFCEDCGEQLRVAGMEVTCGCMRFDIAGHECFKRNIDPSILWFMGPDTLRITYTKLNGVERTFTCSVCSEKGKDKGQLFIFDHTERKIKMLLADRIVSAEIVRRNEEED